MEKKYFVCKDEKKFSKKEIEKLKKIVLSMSSRHRGEILLQYIGCVINGDKYKTGDYYDTVRSMSNIPLKVEYKSAISVKNDSKISYAGQPLEEWVMNYREKSFSTMEEGNNNMIIQNIKTDCFDLLDYAVFADDGIHIFEIGKNEIEEKVGNNEFPSWCKRHGSKENGNCQFTISNKNIGFHEKYYVGTLSWNTLRNTLSQSAEVVSTEGMCER